LSPNGSQTPVSEECGEEDTAGDGTDSTTYEVSGATDQEACSNLFDTSGPEDPLSGVRYGGRTDFSIGVKWTPGDVPTELIISEITWVTSMLLPSWSAPDGADTANWGDLGDPPE